MSASRLCCSHITILTKGELVKKPEPSECHPKPACGTKKMPEPPITVEILPFESVE
jgi:hypothetical protein